MLFAHCIVFSSLWRFEERMFLLFPFDYSSYYTHNLWFSFYLYGTISLLFQRFPYWQFCNHTIFHPRVYYHCWLACSIVQVIYRSMNGVTVLFFLFVFSVSSKWSISSTLYLLFRPILYSRIKVWQNRILSLLRSIRRQTHRKMSISVSFQTIRHQFGCFYCQGSFSLWILWPSTEYRPADIDLVDPRRHERWGARLLQFPWDCLTEFCLDWSDETLRNKIQEKGMYYTCRAGDTLNALNAYLPFWPGVCSDARNICTSWVWSNSLELASIVLLNVDLRISSSGTL